MSATPTMALLQLCRSSPSLIHHPDVACALVNKNVDDILSHLRQQREWFGKLNANARERLDVRRSPVIKHAREACAALNNYEQCLRATA